MLFNTIDFAIFLPTVFILYWFVANRNLKLQNFIIAISSYVFYGWWDWRFLSLIFFSTIVDYLVGLELNKQDNERKRKILLLVSIAVNLGFLGFFKYYNFFLDNFISAFSFVGMEIKANSLNIILPVGISFYTFQTMSYTIDVYKRKLEPTKDFIAFSAFVSFFPQLVAGPIERATNLLPQFYKTRVFDKSKAIDGMRQILWGLFKKVVIADNAALLVNQIFSDYSDQNGAVLIIGAFLFAFQIYGDFSGYSDIAIGTSRLFGFNLMRNFAYPYFSRDIAEFWRRWHISLSSWFRDYLYIPLGGSKGSIWIKVRNTFAIFVVSGFWHGANWTFIAWGLLNAIYFLPLLLLNKNRINTDMAGKGKSFPSFKELIQILVTFILTLIAWVFFRSLSITDAINYLSIIFISTDFNNIYLNETYVVTLLAILLLVIVEWHSRNKQHALESLLNKSSFKHKIVLRYLIYTTLLFSIFLFAGDVQDFIYFQF